MESLTYEELENKVSQFQTLLNRITAKLGSMTVQLEESNMMLESYAKLADDLQKKLDKESEDVTDQDEVD